MPTSFAIFHGGNIVNEEFGVSYYGGAYTTVNLNQPVLYYASFYGYIKDAMDPNAVINRIVFRKPMLLQNGGVFFGLVEISENSDLESMYRVMRHFPMMQFIELFVEYDSLNVTPHGFFGTLLPNSQLAHDDDSRHGIMTSNFAESYNAMLKKMRSLPVTSFMKMMLTQLVELFNKNRERNEQAHLNGEVFTDVCRRILERRVEKSHGHSVTNYDRRNGVMSITTAYNNISRKGNNVQIVKLDEGKCTCEKFQQSKIPCSHAIAACLFNNIDYRQYIFPYFTIAKNMEVWSPCFVPLPNMSYWPPMSFSRIIPNPDWKRQKGRPQSKRIMNEMDWGGRDHIVFCSKCGKTGHNRRSCPRNN